MNRRILVIGGTGVFGRRLVVNLARQVGCDLIIASRDRRRAETLAASLSGAATVQGIALDHRQGLRHELDRLKPWLVIDASGPFQGAGYRIPQAAIAAGAHVVDLADASDYLRGYRSALDVDARSAGVAALAGASSTPALSGAATAALTEGWRRIDTVRLAITPGGRGEVGSSVVQAVLGYAGRPVAVWREGRLQSAPAWRWGHTVDMPGLGRRRVALVETFDAELLGERHHVASSVIFEAGLESVFEQTGLEVFAALRQTGWIGNPAWLAPMLTKARAFTRIGTGDRGAMVVRATGLDADGRFAEACWSLLASDGDGPHVPTLPAVALVRALSAGGVASGARLAGADLTLGRIEAELAPLSITCRRRHDTAASSLFASIVGATPIAALPPAVGQFHAINAAPVWRGEAEVATGGGWPGRLLRHWFGMPEGGKNVPVTVSVERSTEPLREAWTRNFAGEEFTSDLRRGGVGQVIERFGRFSFTLRPEATSTERTLPVVGWRLLGLPMPGWLGPRSAAREYEDAAGRFRFDVRLSLPLLGLIVHYRGWLVPDGRGKGAGDQPLTGHRSGSRLRQSRRGADGT